METPSPERSGPRSFHLLGVGPCAFPPKLDLIQDLANLAKAAKFNTKNAEPKTPEPPSVLDSARTSPAPFGGLFGTGLSEQANSSEQEHVSGASGTSYPNRKYATGRLRTKVIPSTGGKPIIVSLPKTGGQDG
jgi:hypothetical protein